ncbi:AAA family ATPase [Pseudomonas fluorescens]|uniref:AAA family ATPase n=1 Tax=Pseudomonas fluorescens TaxID=294 RepID=UPI003D21635B
MKLPVLDDLIDEQMQIYDAPPDQNLFVLGPPGSGKTTMAVHRTQYLRNLNRSAVLITRNRMLAALAAQLGGRMVATKTMSTFFTTDFFTRFNSTAPQPFKRFHYDWPAVMTRYEAANVQPTLDHLIIDEGQNLPAAFYAWAVRFGAKTVTVFADEDQTTDSQRASIQDIRNAPMPEPVRLTENHRNTEEIAWVAEHFHHRANTLPPGIIRRGRGGSVPRLESVSNWAEALNLIANGYRNRGGSIGVIVHKVKDALAVQAQLQSILETDTRIDVYTHESARDSEHCIKLMTPGITVLTSLAVIGLEFNTVYLQDLFRSSPESITEEQRRLYMLCARARDHLTIFNGLPPLTQHQLSRLPAPNLLNR